MRTKGFWFLLLGLALSGVIMAAFNSRNFEKAECQFQAPAGMEVKCGYLSVPEDRSRRGSPTIRLHVAIFEPLSGQPAGDPLVVLNGGPGNPTLDASEYWLYVFSRVMSNRELILFDQRGVGYSQPSLDCPEVEQQAVQDWKRNLSVEQEEHNHVQALQACRNRLVRAGIELSAYNTAENAADVRDLRRALGYPTWNVYGGAYGSRLALAVMDRDPHGIRSVILDSADPPQVNFYSDREKNMQNALDLLFQRCEADKPCHRSLPHLRQTFLDSLQALKQKPIVYRIYNPASGTLDVLTLNGDRWVWAVSQMFYGSGFLPGLPRRIEQLQVDTTFSFSKTLSWIVSRNGVLSEGAYYSIQCAEEMPLSATSSVETDSATTAPLKAMDPDLMAQDCSAWQVSRAAAAHKAVTSSIPTLILSGGMDPITPPAWGKLAAQTLSRSQFVEFPGFGHGVLGSGPDGGSCTFQIAADFINAPKEKVDTSCIQSLDMGFLNP